jgi:hypothetical protein
MNHRKSSVPVALHAVLGSRKFLSFSGFETRVAFGKSFPDRSLATHKFAARRATRARAFPVVMVARESRSRFVVVQKRAPRRNRFHLVALERRRVVE